MKWTVTAQWSGNPEPATPAFGQLERPVLSLCAEFRSSHAPLGRDNQIGSKKLGRLYE